MRIAYFTPVSPQRTGIADYSEHEILPYLSKYCDIDVYIDRGIKPTNPNLYKNFDCFSYDKYEKKAHNYDIPIYQMGNSDFHAFIYNSLLKYPGITVLHDIYLHGFLWSQSIAKGNLKRYIAEFQYCYGDQGVNIANNAIRTGSYPEFSYPLNKRIVDKSLGIICHSEFGAIKVLAEQPNAICSVIPQPFTVHNDDYEIDNSEMEKLLQTWGVTNKYPILVSFGLISIHKRYNIILNVFKKLLEIYPHAFWVIIGQDNIDIKGTIKENGLHNHVIITGYVSDECLTKIIKISDFCVNLRYPTAGETSRSVLQIMSQGKPVIVSNVGWFSEIPDNCSIKIDVNSSEVDLMLEYMKILSSNECLRIQIGKNALEYIKHEHDPKNAAKDYFTFIRRILNGDEIVFNIISNGLTELGIEETDNSLLKHISTSFKGLF